MFIYLPLSFCLLLILIWLFSNRKYRSSNSVSSSYDAWTKDKLLEKLWGEHIHLGYYVDSKDNLEDFRKAKIDFVHKLVEWSGLDKLPRGSRIIDIGCGIGGSSRILAKEYGFDVLGITLSTEQVRRARELTTNDISCRFEVMNALDLNFEAGSFDGIWSVEVGAHIPNKQLYADEMYRVLRPGGVLAVADWNSRDNKDKNIAFLDRLIMRQLLDQWSHPEFSSIENFRLNLLNSKYSVGNVETQDWTEFTLPSWSESILEGFRRPKVLIGLGPKSILQGVREIPTILLMRWAFSSGLMKFGVYRARG